MSDIERGTVTVKVGRKEVRRRVIRLRSSGKVYQQITPCTGMSREVDEKVAVTFVPYQRREVASVDAEPTEVTDPQAPVTAKDPAGG